MKVKVYGIKNCNTVQKALVWLKDHHVDVVFSDFKKSGVTEAKLKQWAGEVSWEALLNKRGTTWKQLYPAVQNAITSEEAAFKLMQEKTSVIKRPVTETEDGRILLGFDEDQFSDLFSK